ISRAGGAAAGLSLADRQPRPGAGRATRQSRGSVQALSLPYHHELHQCLPEGPQSGQSDRRDKEADGRAAGGLSRRGSCALRVFAGAVGLLLLSGLPAFAQYADSSQQLTLARQVVSELITDDRIAQIADSFLPVIIGGLRAHGIKVTPAAEVGIRQVVHDEMHNVIDESLGDLASAYAATFTADELSELDKFYGSDVGKKLLVEEPKLMGGFMPKIATKVQADMPALQSKIRTVFASLPQGGQ